MSLQEKNIYTKSKLKELSIYMERLNRKYQAIVQALPLSVQELTAYMEDSDNFSAHEWEELQSEKRKLDEMLNLELSNIRDTIKSKKTSSEQSQIQQHWLFVR